jgi:hypothetical protein
VRSGASVSFVIALVAAGGAHACPVTLPNHVVPTNAGFSRAAFNYGNAHLRAQLNWADGVLRAGVLPDGGSVATVQRDGSIWAKLGWWRGVPGRLVITGRRLDAPAPPLRADVPTGYGSTGFQATGLEFATVGCWRVVGRQGSAKLTFVVRVTKLRPRSG